MTFIGKFAAVGMGGAGKTRSVLEIANFLLGQQKYLWSEDQNVAGTMTVTPYSITLPSKNKKILQYNQSKIYNFENNQFTVISPGNNPLYLFNPYDNFFIFSLDCAPCIF